MSDENTTPGGDADVPGRDIDVEEPVPELRDLGWTPDEAFVRRVSGGIERRLLTGHLLDVAWSAPLMVLLELVRAPFELFSSNRRT